MNAFVEVRKSIVEVADLNNQQNEKSMMLGRWEKTPLRTSTNLNIDLNRFPQSIQELARMLRLLSRLLRKIIDLYIYNYLKSLAWMDSLSRTFVQKRIKSQQSGRCSCESKTSQPKFTSTSPQQTSTIFASDLNHYEKDLNIASRPVFNCAASNTHERSLP